MRDRTTRDVTTSKSREDRFSALVNLSRSSSMTHVGKIVLPRIYLGEREVWEGGEFARVNLSEMFVDIKYGDHEQEYMRVYMRVY